MKTDSDPDIADLDASLLLVMDALWSARNVSRAARRLGRSQSTVSASLGRLREVMKDQVFVWDGRQMNPTPLAEQLMPQVSDLISGLRSLVWRAHGGAQRGQRRFVIATSSYVTALFAASIINRIEREMPGLSLDFIAIGESSWSKSGLPDIDLFIIPSNLSRTRGLHTSTLYMDEYVCIGSANNHRLLEGMSVEDFQALVHVGYSSVPRLTTSHEATYWHADGVVPNYVVQSPEYLSLPATVAASNAVAIVPGRLAKAALRDYNIKCVRPPVRVPALEIVMVWKPSQHGDPVHSWLRDTLVELSGDFGA